MKLISENENLFVLRFYSGTEVVESLINFCSQKGIEGAWLTGLGSSSNAVIAYYDLDSKSYKDHELNGSLEVAGLTGNIAKADGKLFLHMHGIFAEPDLRARAGHIKKLVVGATCEIYLSVVPGGLNRKHDDKTGLNLLD